jgi:hypothetical protein
MYRLPRFLVWLLLFGAALYGQNPHGQDFKINCADCHNSGSWQVSLDDITFDHGSTGFDLNGRHATVQCMDCHQNLEFAEVGSTCVDCHLDLHNMTVGDDCRRCHDEQSWLIFEIPELHEQNGFPLQGAHSTVACIDCHQNANVLAWERIGQECVDCHQADYQSTTDPNHLVSGFSIDCIQCHEPMSLDWGGENFHYFFPLVLGHDNLDCTECHISTSFNQIQAICSTCHIDDYQLAQNPNHVSSGFPTDCALCHTTNPGWAPADFRNHDAQYFPIYSGNHQGEWSSCTECHLDPSNYSLFSCIDCHEHNNEADMRDEHDGVGSYRFESNACYSCHPQGNSD